MDVFNNPNLSRQAALAVQDMPLEIQERFIEALLNADSVSDLSPQHQNYLKNGYEPAKVTKSLEEALDQVKIEWEN
jgi:hypothetical protein